MDEKQTKKRARRRRRLIILVGLAAGGVMFYRMLVQMETMAGLMAVCSIQFSSTCRG